MRYLHTEEEILEADHYMLEATREACKSPCMKSKRGVVIVRDDMIIGRGCNSPPNGFECNGLRCFDTEHKTNHCLQVVDNSFGVGFASVSPCPNKPCPLGHGKTQGHGDICSDYCVHAEENAIFDALDYFNKDFLIRARSYHVSVKDNEVVYSKQSFCARCSSKILDNAALCEPPLIKHGDERRECELPKRRPAALALGSSHFGISEIVMKHEEDFVLYDANEFHELSLRSVEEGR